MPVGALQFWEQRLAEYGISVTKGSRISEPYLAFADYDGLRIELVEREEGPLSKWSFGGIPTKYAIKGFGGAVLYSSNPLQTAETLVHTLGMEHIADGDGYTRYRTNGELGNIIDLKTSPVPLGAEVQGQFITSRGGQRMMQSNWNGRAMYRVMGIDLHPFKTVSILMRSISVKEEESCSRSLQILQVLPVMKPQMRWVKS